MNEAILSLSGNVATDVRSATTQGGVPVATFRMASSTRRFDRQTNQWNDVDTLFVTVVCWRQQAENVSSSIAKGDPITVTGRMRVRPWKNDDGNSGVTIELEAHALGHDLSRGTSAFRRSAPKVQSSDARDVVEALTAELESEPLDGVMTSDVEGLSEAVANTEASQRQAA